MGVWFVFYFFGLLQYGLICPSVICLPTANDCSLVEYIVLEYDVYVDGRSVKIRCQSCPYCLDDWPLGRKRRSVHDVLGASSDTSCASLTCPSVSDTCNDVRNTDVLLRDTHCKTCPACYDSTVLRHPQWVYMVSACFIRFYIFFKKKARSFHELY